MLRRISLFFEDLRIKRLPKTKKIYLPLNTNKIQFDTRFSDETKFAITQQSSHLTARVEERSSILDIGGHSGFYGINVARQFPNSWVISVEPDKELVRTSQRVAEVEKIVNFSSLSCALNPTNVSGLPQFDYVINLSVFHQWVRSFGFESAHTMLSQVWAKTKGAMFFSMADTLGSPKNLSHLPNMGLTHQDCRKWIEEHVLDLPNSMVSMIDEVPSSYEASLPRFLFSVTRVY